MMNKYKVQRQGVVGRLSDLTSSVLPTFRLLLYFALLLNTETLINYTDNISLETEDITLMNIMIKIWNLWMQLSWQRALIYQQKNQGFKVILNYSELEASLGYMILYLKKQTNNNVNNKPIKILLLDYQPPDAT